MTAFTCTKTWAMSLLRFRRRHLLEVNGSEMFTLVIYLFVFTMTKLTGFS